MLSCFLLGVERGRVTAVGTMACVGSSRFCVRVQEKLCQWGQSQGSAVLQVRRKATATSSTVPVHQAKLSTFRNIYSAQECQNTLAASAAAAASVGSLHPCSRPEFAATARSLATMRTQQPGSLPEYQVDPYHLLEDDLKDVYGYIRQALRRNTYQEELHEIATYYFDGQGKAIRPMVAILMARAINYHMYKGKSGLIPSQREVAMISEMIHTASLVHDDVIDQSDFRRGKPSVNVMWNHKKVRLERLFFFFYK
ncbi:PREDICTED: decaprenyl-diphosphate synthase subunit 1 [Nicrophorus vespilloides]|uniref:Decaprenyl-diphosphate synthase subunit 1 n=1 Tax=Nicrophorus vespilloides TaxID=110193 RepID=A0ABM1MCQ1_NICVS|nr:PREDICTED: decaprenyl-diphosphate synthase subunit 1 [Nicrophorus vespilloides]